MACSMYPNPQIPNNQDYFKKLSCKSTADLSRTAYPGLY